MNLTVFYTSGRAGRSCTQGIAGLLIERLRGDGEVFAFHLPRDKFVLLCPDPKYSWWITGPSVMKNVDITKPSSKPHVHLQPEKGRKIARTDDQSVLAM